MKPNVNKMIKEILMDGFRRSGYVLEKTNVQYPRGEFVMTPSDIARAYKNADMLLDIWQIQEKAGKSVLPPTFQEFENFLDIKIAEHSFTEAFAFLNRRFSDRSNKELVNEMRGAIEELKRLGCDGSASSFEFLLNQRIGEE
ncbi:MAG: hypothetical protein ACYDHA_12630 [Bellilinea sp.]